MFHPIQNFARTNLRAKTVLLLLHLAQDVIGVNLSGNVAMAMTSTQESGCKMVAETYISNPLF